MVEVWGGDESLRFSKGSGANWYSVAGVELGPVRWKTFLALVREVYFSITEIPQLYNHAP